MLTAQTIADVHGNRSDDSWASIRLTLRNHYKRRTGQLPSADTLQDLLIAFMARSQRRSDLADDQFGRTVARAVGDVIVDKVQADADQQAELDAAQTYAQLKRDNVLIPESTGRGTSTIIEKRRPKARTYGEQSLLDCIRTRLAMEFHGTIEIYRPEVTDTRFA